MYNTKMVKMRHHSNLHRTIIKRRIDRGEVERTQVGVMRGEGAAKTGLFWMRLGTEGEGLLSFAETQGRTLEEEEEEEEEGLLRERRE